MLRRTHAFDAVSCAGNLRIMIRESSNASEAASAQLLRFTRVKMNCHESGVTR